jgi:SAM-dependent methyltransferase
MFSQLRRDVIKHYIGRALSPSGVSKIVGDPAVVMRAVKTVIGNRNLRSVSAEELLRDSEEAVHGLARLATPSVADWPNNHSPDAAALGELLLEHGSDKSTHHDYHEVYASLLDRRARLRILEIGLGTNNLAIQSNMGLGGRPGASLRAFRDWAPHAAIFGADVDRDILFEEERIKTFFVDQTNTESLKLLSSQVGANFDLIIDDGLHLPHANLNTIEALLPLLKPGGTMVIEAIDPVHLHYWHAASGILGNTRLLNRRGGYLFLIPSRADQAARNQ